MKNATEVIANTWGLSSKNTINTTKCKTLNDFLFFTSKNKYVRKKKTKASLPTKPDQ